MKKSVYFITCIYLVMLVGCCSSSTPKSTVREYLENMKNGKYREAVNLFVFEGEKSGTGEELDELAKKIEEGSNEEDKIINYKILSEEINTDRTQAKVIAKVFYADGSDDEMDFNLKKIDEKWRIVLNK